MFATTDLAERIERAEAVLLREAAGAIAQRRGVDVLMREIAGGVAAFTVNGSPLNKAIGLGFAGRPDDPALADLEREFEARGTPLLIEISTLSDASIFECFSRRGYLLRGFRNVLGCHLDDRLVLPDAARGLEVRALPDGEQPDWVDVLVDGFMVPDAEGVAPQATFARDVLGDVMSDFCSIDGMRRYLASRDGQVAGGGSARFTDRIAQFCGTSTLEEHRRRGVQNALLARRLADAREAGCEVAVITVQPGSKSMRNALRRGFSLLYSRAALVASSGSQEPPA